MTDGYAVSIIMIKKSDAIIKKKNKKKPSVKIVKDNDVAKMNNNKEEFTYYDKLPPDKLLDLLLSNRIYIDPGKNNLISAVDDNGNEFIYTNRRRLKESKRLKYQKLLNNYKGKNGISKIENKFKLNSKTCDIEKFKEYIKGRIILEQKLTLPIEI